MNDVTPNLSGFIDAQQRLRQKLGRVVTFYTPQDVVYQPGVKLDPETQRPYDPTIRPTSSGALASGSAIASVVFAPLNAIRRDETQVDRLGRHSRFNKDLILDIADRAVADNATYFELDGERWEIVDVRPDGIGSEQRLVVFGQAEK